jgi:hypothetical protein
MRKKRKIPCLWDSHVMRAGTGPLWGTAGWMSGVLALFEEMRNVPRLGTNQVRWDALLYIGLEPVVSLG